MERNEKNNEFLEKLVHINRITKVVSQGFASLSSVFYALLQKSEI